MFFTTKHTKYTRKTQKTNNPGILFRVFRGGSSLKMYRKKRKHLLWIMPAVLCLLACLGGLVALSPVLLLFTHVPRLPGLSSPIQEDFEFLADLMIVESSDQVEEPVNIIHSLTVTLPEEAVEQMLYESLHQKPGRLMAIRSVRTQISPDRMQVDLDVDYTLRGHVVFNTSFTSEWLLRTSPSLLASPMPSIVELAPLTIRASYWPSVEWTPLWEVMTGTRANNGWIALEFTSSFRLEDLNIEEGELALSIAPAK
jgi:hypothetical protein